MKKLLPLIAALLLSSCSSKNVTGVTDEPQTVVLPSHCETTEAARFNRDEEVLLVYKDQKPEVIKSELECMMLKGIGDGMRRNHLVGSNKPFGVSTFDIDRHTITRYYVSPLRSTFSIESVTPDPSGDTFNIDRKVFIASPYDVAVVMGASGLFNLPLIAGGDGTLTKEQVYLVLGTYFHGGSIKKKTTDAK